MFFVDHQALLYLINKAIIIGQIARWLLLLQEFDFKMIFKPSWVHFLLDQLSIINHGEPTIGITHQLHETN
jgi:hypothetical protein